LLVLGFLEYKHWISVNWTVAENQSTAIMTHVANKITTVTQHMNHEIPIGMGLLGFAPGVLLGFYKGWGSLVDEDLRWENFAGVFYLVNYVWPLDCKEFLLIILSIKLQSILVQAE
jgi:hypothetical protein